MKTLKKHLKLLGFSLESGTNNKWIKKYSLHNNYEISILLDDKSKEKSIINYSPKPNIGIQIGRKTTCNFSQNETFVVLECVDRLLEKGYKPENIHLEKSWRVGGYLDIAVYDNKNNLYLMIECKTWGRPYNQALQYMLENNPKQDQLFNYYLQDKNAKFLLLYTSRIKEEDNSVIYKNDIIDTKAYSKCLNIDEIYSIWDNTFESKGIFEDSIEPYHVKLIGIQKKDLIPLNKIDVEGSEDADGTIYNRFAEILRRHTVSDKTNAYNKIFNLFLCKIVDEDSVFSDEEEMSFQWKNDENAKDVLSRLNDLYKTGMNDYLKLDIADVSDEDIETTLNNIVDQDTILTLRTYFEKLRLYRSNEFSFKEVIDEETFLENATVVKEVVKLLAPYQLKYQSKHQFLGDFFETLLNIGVKQESGQFFTPIPIATYICASIPFEEIINKKLESKNQNFLPYVIDNACGSGHFLTEAMDRIDYILQNTDNSQIKSKPQHDNFENWKISYKWANEFVYGVEKDYRLTKTTKVACFLNGDGEANIFNADGLESFNSNKYRGILHTNKESQLNEVFDVLIANPPYSVENFKFTLKNGKKDFKLFDAMTSKSDDIECLFVERVNQLLKVGGYAGIVLPRSILINKSHHKRAREIILKNFEIKGLTLLGKNTFTDTGTQTVILFLKKIDSSIYKNAKRIVTQFLKDFNDCSYMGHENIFTKYFLRVDYEYSKEEYQTKILTEQKFKKEETEKLVLFLMTFKKKIIVTNTGETNEEEKLFLGYEHSSMKKYEGIHPYPYNDTNEIISKLYNVNREKLYDTTKANYYMLKNFKDEAIDEISIELENNIKIEFLHDMIDYESSPFHYKIFTEKLHNPFIKKTTFPMVTIKQLSDQKIVSVRNTERKPIKKSQRTSGNIPYYGATGQNGTIDSYIFNEKLLLIGEDGAKWAKYDETAYIIEGTSWVNNHAHVLSMDENKIMHEYLMYIFNYLDFSFLKTRPNGGKLQLNDLMNIQFPFPSFAIQEKLVQEMNKIKSTKKFGLLESTLLK